jgi:hypothetical protein
VVTSQKYSERGHTVKVEHKEKCRTHAPDVILYGEASWGGGKSVKYGWYDKRGRISRGGEVPIEALPQMLEVAIREGGFKLGRLSPTTS